MLFLCTANYYRSRLAEEYFNHLAEKSEIPWHADSRGLSRDFTVYPNPGPIARQTLEVLSATGVQPKGADRHPRYLQNDELDGFARIIALSKAEHEPMVERWFPELSSCASSRLEYWEIGDVHIEGVSSATSRILHHVEELVRELTE